MLRDYTSVAVTVLENRMEAKRQKDKEKTFFGGLVVCAE